MISRSFLALAVLWSFVIVQALQDAADIDYGGLSCYQCETFGRRADPNCAASWNATSAGARSNIDLSQYAFSCPFRSGFCYKRKSLGGKVFRMRLGCLNLYTKRGHRLREGCIETVDKDNVAYLTCICKGNLCNLAIKHATMSGHGWTTIMIFSMILMCIR